MVLPLTTEPARIGAAATRAPLLARTQAEDWVDNLFDSLAAEQLYQEAWAAQPGTPPSPEDSLANVMKAALEALKGIAGEFADFPATAADTVLNAKKQFAGGIWDGLCAYIESEIDTYKEIAGDVGGFFAGLGGCLKTTFLSGPDDVAQGDPCKQFRDIGASIQSLAELAQQIWNLTFAELLEIAKQLLDFAMRVFRAFLTQARELLKEWQNDVIEWLQKVKRDAVQLGELAGSLVAAVAIEWLTGGVGRAMKSAKLAKLAKYVPDITPGTLTVVPGPPEVASLAGAKKKLKSPEEILEHLAMAFEEVLNKEKLEFNRNLTLGKHRTMRRHVDKGLLREFKENRSAILKHLNKQYRSINARRGTHGANLDLERPFNRGTVTFHYAEALVDDPKGEWDLWDLRLHKDTLVPRLFESNHIFESHVFLKTQDFPKFKEAYGVLGWTGRNNMPAIVMAASHHTSSLQAMLRRQGIPEAEIALIAPPGLPDSLSKLQAKFIRFKGDPNVPKGALVIDKDTKFTAVLDKYEEIFTKHMPDVYKDPMIAELNLWRKALEKLP